MHKIRSHLTGCEVGGPTKGSINRGLGKLLPLRLGARQFCACNSPSNCNASTSLPNPCNMSDERRPRSRFDSDDADRPVRSRFDTERRSRSPSRRESESQSHRARSPVAREASDSPSTAGLKNKAAAAAAAAAARINAQIAAKKGIQHVDVPPIRAVSPAHSNLENALLMVSLGADSSSRQVTLCRPRSGCLQRDIPARWRLHQGYRDQ